VALVANNIIINSYNFRDVAPKDRLHATATSIEWSQINCQINHLHQTITAWWRLVEYRVQAVMPGGL